MKIEKKWKKYHKLLIIPLMAIIMFVSATIGVKASSIGNIYGNEYWILSPTNPDYIIMGEEEDGEAMYCLGGQDVYYYKQGFPNGGGDGWSIFNPASEEFENIFRTYSIKTATQLGRFKLFTNTWNESYWAFDTIEWYKEDFFLLKRDCGTGNSQYGLFPQISLEDVNGNNLIINYFVEARIHYIQNGELQDRQVNFSGQTQQTPYDFEIRFMPGDFGLSNVTSDNTIIHFDYFKMTFGCPVNYARFSYGYTLIAPGGDTATDDLYGDITNTFLEQVASLSSGGGPGGTIFDVGASMLTSVNSFFQFELLPGFSLFNILTIVLAIPLLIWILKLIMGG